MKKILVLAPHCDDGEIGCGASIARLIEEGAEVYYIAFSISEESIPKNFPSDIAKYEVKEATGILGIEEKNLIILNYKVRNFKEKRQNILDDLIKIRKKIKPDTIFIPSSYDIHQDHKTIYEEALRAFKKVNIFGYEFPWNNFSIKNDFFIRIEERHLEKKISSVKAYKSQYFRSYVTEDFIKSLAVVRGVQGNSKLAESFEIIRFYY